AASLARHGLTASPTALEGPRGLLSAYGDRAAARDLLDGFGTQWRVLEPQPADPPRSGHPAGGHPASEHFASEHPASNPGDLARRLAPFASGLDLDKVPETARHAGCRALANVLALAVDAAAHPAVRAVAASLRDLGLRGTTPVIGRDETASPYAAAL